MTTMRDPNLLRVLETCIRNGKALIIEDLGEQIEPALEPVLQKAVYKQGNRQLIRLGDSEVDFDDNFKLYMTTKLPNPVSSSFFASFIIPSHSHFSCTIALFA